MSGFVGASSLYSNSYSSPFKEPSVRSVPQVDCELRGLGLKEHSGYEGVISGTGAS